MVMNKGRIKSTSTSRARGNTKGKVVSGTLDK